MLADAHPLLLLAVVLVAGVLCGSLAKRLGLPAVTGQILVGVALGPSVIGVFDVDSIHGLHPITDFALGLIAVKVGNHLNVRKLRNAGKRLVWLVALEATVTPGLVLAAITLVPIEGATIEIGLLLAAMAVSTAPATIVALVGETRARGVFVKTLVAAVALNNIACIALFDTAHTAARLVLDTSAEHSALDLVLAPLAQLGGAALLGFGIGAALVFWTRKIVHPDQIVSHSMIAILVAAGLGETLSVSPLLTSLFLGVSLANLTPERNELGHGVFANFESAIFAVFFTLAGLELDFGHALSAGGIALVVLVARILGKVSSGWLAMRLAGATDRVRANLGLALVPQAGVAVGLVLLLQDDPAFEHVYDLFLAVGLTVVTLNEIIGPLLTRSALQRAGEAGKDRERLIDFLHEENIVTNLRAETKEEAIEKLTDVLVRSNNLDADKDELLRSILDREAEVSTCFGGGLAVPHGVLPHGDTMVGAMGLSSEGFEFDAPDGRRVHCIVVIATPPTQRDRHLEVLAALARAIGTDPSIQAQLFHAGSPAHAYEILHAEEAEDFNYFLDD